MPSQIQSLPRLVLIVVLAMTWNVLPASKPSKSSNLICYLVQYLPWLSTKSQHCAADHSVYDQLTVGLPSNLFGQFFASWLDDRRSRRRNFGFPYELVNIVVQSLFVGARHNDSKIAKKYLNGIQGLATAELNAASLSSTKLKHPDMFERCMK